jgi:hypothetical protein
MLLLFRLTPLTGIPVTVTAQVAVLFPSSVVTVIVAVPGDLVLTVIRFPMNSLKVATAELLVFQLMVWFAAVSGLTVAIRVSDPPAAKERLVWLRLTPLTGTAPANTVTAQVAVLFPSSVVTVIVAVPGDFALTLIQEFPVDSIKVATSELLVVQLTVLLVALLGLTVALTI